MKGADMKTIYSIKCEVVENEFCPYVQGSYIFTRLTPENMCAATFSSIWPFANAMRHSPKTGFEDANGCVTLNCPDGWVQFRLSRISPENQGLNETGETQ
ncbi:MAG TPA: hypothetical protein DHV36_21425 [Desulfobacteraceae bacterium]|nr:hypothetical protein [Desulfobacteraceae bacterium]